MRKGRGTELPGHAGLPSHAAAWFCQTPLLVQTSLWVGGADSDPPSTPWIGATPQGFHRHEIEESLPPGSAAARQPICRFKLATRERGGWGGMRPVWAAGHDSLAVAGVAQLFVLSLPGKLGAGCSFCTRPIASTRPEGILRRGAGGRGT